MINLIFKYFRFKFWRQYYYDLHEQDKLTGNHDVLMRFLRRQAYRNASAPQYFEMIAYAAHLNKRTKQVKWLKLLPASAKLPLEKTNLVESTSKCILN